MTERRGAALLALAAVLAWALVPQQPNYDAMFHLVWGRELLGGSLPSYDAWAAPTPHPLYVLVAAAAGPLGGTRALVLVTVLSWVALVWGAYRLGRAALGRWPGLVGAALVASSFALLLYAARAYVDVPFLALVLWAAALEAQRPPRGAAAGPVPLPAVLLLVAGLLRPEAWVLAGLYGLWLRDVRALALAAAAPLLWALSDLAVTGDPLHSLTMTSALAEELGRERGLANVPRVYAREVVDVARPPVALAGLAGGILLWRLRAGRAGHVLVALLLAGTVTFVGAGVAGLSLIPRYLTVPVIALMLLAGYALAGWAALPRDSPLRARWRAVALTCAVLGGTGYVALRPDVLDRLWTELRFTQGVQADLVTVLGDPAVQAGLRCGALTLPTYRLVPDARWELGDDARVTSRALGPQRAGVALVVTGEKAVRRYGRADGVRRTTNAAPPGFRPVARTPTLTAFARCP